MKMDSGIFTKPSMTILLHFMASSTFVPLNNSSIKINHCLPSFILVMVDFMRDIHYHQLQNPDSVNIICATSLGGMLASDWVIRYPSDFNSLIIINSSFKYICKNSERIHKRVRLDMVKILFSL